MIGPQTHADQIGLWLRLIQAKGVGPTLFHRVLAHFGTIEKALGASAGQLSGIEGIGSATAAGILSSMARCDPQVELDAAQREGVYLIHLEDPRYPAPLKEIYDPPPVLYVRGELPDSRSLAVAIVGARQCSLYGQEQAARFAHLLANAGFTIVSGMARGIDTAAHRGALSAGGQTVAVQGCGLTVRYPPENGKLFDDIARQGACLSELSMAAEPKREHFPARNRIIAGLSVATMIVEAGLRSGAMITARLALEHNREVLALPGRIDSALSQGPHQLIKQGACLVESIEDVLAALGGLGEALERPVRASLDALAEREESAKHPLIAQLSESEGRIYGCLEVEPLHADAITGQTHLPAGKVNADLVSLQLKGLVKSLPGNLYRRTGHS